MVDLETQLIRRNGRWHILARNSASGTANAAWVSLGGCPCQLTAIRVWLACNGQGKR